MTTEKLFEMFYLVSNTAEKNLIFSALQNRNLDNIIVDYCSCQEKDVSDDSCYMHVTNVKEVQYG